MKRRIWILILTAVLCCAMFPIGVSAETEYTEGYYTYTVTDGNATITDVDTAISGDVTIPSTRGGYPVTEIGDHAFSYCGNLTSITIPNGITSIGNNAFFNCTGLTSITIPSSVASIGNNAFSGCPKLTSITIPNGITSIGSFAFGGGLISITIPNSVTSIGDGAFSNCYDLTSITVDSGNTNYASEDGVLFNKDKTTLIAYPAKKAGSSYTFPSTVTAIKNHAFSNCANLTSIAIPESVTTIAPYAFNIDNYASLTSITVDSGNTAYISEDGVLFNKDKTTLIAYPAGKEGSSYDIPSTVTSIEAGAFNCCRSLTSITIPSGITSIEDQVFSSCSRLTSITIPDGVISIGNQAFFGCSGLTSITIPKSVMSIHGGVFSGCTNLTIYGYTGSVAQSYASQESIPFVALDALTEGYYTYTVTDDNATITYVDTTISGDVTIPSTLGDYPVTGIGDYAFSNCSNLTSITIPTGITSIGNRAFSNCSNLTNITIPSSVTSIGTIAFSGCRNLTNITIPSSVTSIGTMAFSGCTGLTSITVDSENTNYASEDGVLFNKDKTTLIAYPANKAGSSYTIPGTVTSIGQNAFSTCTGLTSITIPSSVTSIGQIAFANCTNLTNITIPNSVTSIGVNAFANCTNLTIYGYTGSTAETYATENDIPFVALDKVEKYATYTVTDGNATITDVDTTISGDVVIPSTLGGYPVTEIGVTAFSGCRSLTSITIPSSVTSIGVNAFLNCNSLTSITVDSNNETYASEDGVLFSKDKTTLIAYPAGKAGSSYTISNTVTSIGYGAFADCTNLTNITIPSGVTSIGTMAFSGCTGLTSITIPSSVTSIASVVFGNCSSLTGITVDSDNETYASEDGVLFNKDKTTLIAYPAGKAGSSYTIPNTVTSIGHNAFSGCTNLTSITIPSGVTSIGNFAFSGCSGLTSITIPNTVTSIGVYAFSGCTALTSVTIPKSVTSIGNRAFLSCLNLTIYGYTGSTAETYATENNLPFVAVDLVSVPVITSHPASAIYKVGDTAAALTVTATGEGLTYQWYEAHRNSSTVTKIDGATSASYTPTLRDFPCEQFFYVIVTADNGLGGYVRSETAVLTINAAEEESITTKSVINQSFDNSDIPAELAQTGLNTVEKIEIQMKTEILNYDAEISTEDTALYDVILMYSTDGGKNWIKADETHFPKDGRLLVTLPVPEGTHPDTHEYTILHMFTTSDFGKKPGDVEKPDCTVRRDTDGTYYLDFYVTGLSPITIGWKDKDTAETDNENLFWLLFWMMNQRFDVTVETTEGGQVQLTETEVKYDKSVTVTLVPNAGYEIGTVTVNGQAAAVDGNTVTIRNIRKDQHIAVTFQKLPWVNPFTDVPADADYMEALAFVCANGLFEGESATAFAPGKPMTRAMFVTVLGRLAGVAKDYAGNTDFTDAADGMWYTPYVQWAQDNGIVQGHGNGLFGIDEEITIEQAAVILYRYAQHAGIPVEFTVVLTDDEVSSWAADAMAWAVEAGIYTGTNGKLNPQAPASRALIAQMLYNFCMMSDSAE